MVPLQGFIGGAYKLPSVNVAAQRCVNMIVEKVPGNEECPAYFTTTPGFTRLITSFVSQDARLNGLYVTSTGILITAQFSSLFAYSGIFNGLLVSAVADSTGAFAQLEDTFTGPIAMCDNGVILFVSSGNKVYQYPLSDLDDPLGGWISSWPYGGFTHIAYLDGRFLVNTPNLPADDPTVNQFRASPQDWDGDVSTWNPLAFASADQSPDQLLGLIVRGRDVLLFNSGTFEVWYSSGEGNMPYARNVSIANETGIGAKYSLAKTEDSVFWLGSGNDGFNKIFVLDGYTPVKISTSALEYEVSQYDRTDDALGMTYQKNGHSFYILVFPTEDKSWQYDLTTQEWCELSSTGAAGDQERTRYVALAAFEGESVALDRTTCVPVLLNSNLYAEDSRTHFSTILRLRSSPHIYSALKRLFFPRFELSMETGAGLHVGGGSGEIGETPKCRLRWSNDGGHTWSNFLIRDLGALGKYAARVFWTRLGQSRHRVWEWSMSDPTPIRIMGAWIDVEEGEN